MKQTIYTGFHAVEEKIKKSSGDRAKNTCKLLYAHPGPRVKKILELARKSGIPCTEVSEAELNRLVSQLPKEIQNHRGIVLTVEGESNSLNMIDLTQWLNTEREHATVVMLDSVTDPHNVGAILRSCDQFGVDLFIIGQRRSASDVQDNQIIARTSAGASTSVPCAVVTNLVRAAEQLKEKGFWIYGADARGTATNKTSFAEKTCIIMGSEGSGISRLLSEQCDTFVAIPTCGTIDSLNVSVAAGILMYERHRQSL